jgi:glycosyltransferase involved in cell wall biosynthesis
MARDQKTFWLINQYASTPQTGMGGRHYCMARELAKQGHRVYLIAASYTHLLREPPEMPRDVWIQPVEGFQFVWLRVPAYADAHSKKRLVNWFRFAWMLGKLPEVIPDKPDAILYSSPSLVGYLGAQRLAKIYRVPLTFEVRDIWPLSLTEIGGYSPRHPFIRFLQWIEDKAYRESDRVVSNLKNAVEHMQERGMDPDKFAWIPNGFSLDDVANPELLPDSVRSQLPLNKFIVGYTGTLGVANALDTLIEAAERLKAQDDIVFVLVGGGKEKPKLQRLVHEKGLSNVVFIDPIPKAQVQAMLACFNICYIGLINQPLFKYGVSPNKLFDYMLAAKPILYAINSGAYRPIEDSRSGHTISPGDVKSHVDGIILLKTADHEVRKRMGENAFRAVMKDHEYGHLSKELASVMLNNNL